MAIDAGIPLSFRAPQLDPLQTIGGLLQLRNQQQQGQLQAVQLANAERAQADDAALRQALQRRSLGGGLLDWQGAVGDLEREGRGGAALKLREAWDQTRTRQTEQAGKQLDNTRTTLDLLSRTVRGMEAEVAGVTDPVEREELFQRAKRRVAEISSPEVADQLGARYDPARIKAALEWGMTASESLTKQRDLFSEAAKLRDDQRADRIAAPDVARKWTELSGQALSLAKNPEDWRKAQAELLTQGAPANTVLGFGDYSPENAARAAQAAMTPKERADVTGAAETRSIARGNLEVAQGNLRLRQAELDTAKGDVPQLTPEAMDMVAHQFAMTGQMPALGMGAAKVRTDVMNRAAEIYKDLDLPSQQAAYRANQESYKKLTLQKDAIQAFEATALKNLDVFIQQARKVADTGSPYLNRGVRTLDERLLGSPQMAAFNTARRTVIPEFARILSNPNLAGVLSDSARHEVEALMEGDATLPQILAVADVLRTDVKNRSTALEDQLKAIGGRIAKPPAGAAGAGAGAGGQDLVEMVTPDGRQIFVPADRVAEAELRRARRVR